MLKRLSKLQRKWASQLGKKMVWVEIDPVTTYPIRILGRSKDVAALGPDVTRFMLRSSAVGYIREQVIARARRGRIIQCEYCGAPVNPEIGEMHEKIPKGKGGEVSLDNCVFICNDCHTGKQDSEHGDRRFQSAKVKDASNS